MATKKLNEGHYHELLDRLHVQMSIIEEHLEKHPVSEHHNKIKKLIIQSRNKLANAYLATGVGLYKTVTNGTK